MLLKDAECPITNLMKQATHLVGHMVVVNHRRTFFSKRLSAHGTTTILGKEEFVEVLLTQPIAFIAMLGCWTTQWWLRMPLDYWMLRSVS